jgi:peptide/nickel transport system substrate-binding protein
LTPYPSADDMLAAWKANELDIVWPLRATQLAGFDQAGTLYVADAAAVMFAAFNFDNPTRQPPTFFEDLRVRQALNLAVDRAAYAVNTFNTFVYEEQAGAIAQPWATATTLVNPNRDLAAARALLADAGFEDRNDDDIVEDANGAPLALVAIVRNDSRPELLEVMRGLVTDFAEIGVPLDLQILAPEQFRDRWVDQHDFDLIAYAFNQFPGFTDFDLYGSSWNIRINPQGWNPGGYNNAEADVAIRHYLNATSDAEARQALIDLQATTNAELFALWFGFPRDLVLVRPEIRGFQPNKLWQTWNTRSLWRTENP